MNTKLVFWSQGSGAGEVLHIYFSQSRADRSVTAFLYRVAEILEIALLFFVIGLNVQLNYFKQNSDVHSSSPDQSDCITLTCWTQHEQPLLVWLVTAFSSWCLKFL